MTEAMTYLAHSSALPFFLAWQVDQSNPHYNLCFSYQFADGSKAELLRQKLQELVRSKAYLRQTFFIDREKLYGQIQDNLLPEVKYYTTTEQDCPALIKHLIHQQHNLREHSAIKLSIINYKDQAQFIVLFNIHHIIMDAGTLDHFIQDLNRLLANKAVTYESAEQYIQRLSKENAYVSKSHTSDEYIAYSNNVNNIASQLEYPATTKKSWLYYVDELPLSIKTELIYFSQQRNISLFNLLLIAWGIFTAKMFDQQAALIDYPVNIRIDKDIEGAFLNTVTYPLNIHPNESYLTLIASLKKQIKFFKNLAYVNIKNMLKAEANCVFAYSNFAKPDSIQIDSKSYMANAYAQMANSNITMRYCEKNDKFYFTCEIFSDLFPSYFSKTILPRFFNFLNILLQNPEIKISSIDLIFDIEKQKLLGDFNATYKPWVTNKTVYQLFEEQVIKNPNAIAVVCEDKKLTYQELNNQANQLARYIQKEYKKITLNDLKPETLVALCVVRSLEMLVGILGIMKTGAAYVPIEPEYPDERIAFIIKDTNAKLIITQSFLGEKLLRINSNLSLTYLDHHLFKEELAENFLAPNSNPNNLMYVMYTSGTTGYPKGVMIEYKSVVNTLSALDDVYNVEKNKRATAYTNFVFDVSVAEMFAILLKGGELHLLNSERKDINQLSSYLINKKINSVYLPPAVLAILPRIKYPDLNVIIFAGETCSQEVGRYWLTQCEVYNYYGPTETTIYATGKKITSKNVNEIGFPLSNMHTYVLDKQFNLVPIGVTGELYIGGIGLSRGYLNQEVLTDEFFVVNPFQITGQGCSQKLYKTGDLVRYLPDGNLEYIGRNDLQIKLRGYRIELGEIENVLSNYPDIQQSVVLLQQKDTNKYLIGYYLAKKRLNTEKILTYLKQYLPDYMVPTKLIYLKELPLTVNGKLDRKALPIPELTTSTSYEPPTNEKEHLICDAFAKVLNLAKVGVHDDFFNLGGDSLNAISLVSCLQTNFKIDVAGIYKLKTPYKIAADIVFVKNHLWQQLEKIKASYQNKAICPVFNKFSQSKRNDYLSSIQQAPISFQKKPINNVLLTGTTGYLGCHLLNQLLLTTKYTLFVLIRANSSEEAWERLAQKHQLYFDKSIYTHKNRIEVIIGDLEQDQLGISSEQYQELVNEIDSVIHAAALTKHYGDCDKFYSANVKATINLLDLTAKTKLKDFHYISTNSIFNCTDENDINQCSVFTEDDLADKLSQQVNIYIKTKYEGEKAVINYWKQGVLGNIYRVGNLAFNSTNYHIQENQTDNAFIYRLKCLLNLKIAPCEIEPQEISPVDLTAEAIVKLFDKEEIDNGIYHVFNPHLFNLAEFFVNDDSLPIKLLPIDQFIDTLINYLDRPKYKNLVERFLLHQGWMDEEHGLPYSLQILQDRTNVVLKQLGFEWPTIHAWMFRVFLYKANLAPALKSNTVKLPQVNNTISKPKNLQAGQYYYAIDN